MSDIVIEAENLSKYYKLGQYNSGAFYKDMQAKLALRFGKTDPNMKIGQSEKAKDRDGFYALDDVSFKIEQGSCVGIIGRNGAGKSTLLKILSRITLPTEGQVRIKGKVASLLEVGTGFHPEMTGRENIYMNGAIMGMTKRDIDNKIDDIIEFSEIGDHIDTPVKRYSSGMYVRLGFAVAANLDSDILIADEVLAVGDAEFQKKALGKMNDVSTHNGRTVLFVSHQMNAVHALCKEGIVLNEGKIKKTGNIDDCIKYYQKNLYLNNSIVDVSKYNNEFFDLIEFELVDAELAVINNSVHNDDECYVKIKVNMKKLHSAFTIGYAVYDDMGALVYWTNATDSYEKYTEMHLGDNVILGEIPKHFLNEGNYSIRLMTGLHFQEWLVDPDKDSPTRDLVIRGGLSNSPFWTMKRPGICAPVLTWKRVE